jgi:hypothetical protein
MDGKIKNPDSPPEILTLLGDCLAYLLDEKLAIIPKQRDKLYSRRNDLIRRLVDAGIKIKENGNG